MIGIEEEDVLRRKAPAVERVLLLPADDVLELAAT